MRSIFDLFYLPSYCPELNPDEFLNQDVKSHLGKQRLQTKAQMVKTLNSHLKMRQKQPQCHSELCERVPSSIFCVKKCKLFMLPVITHLTQNV